MTLAIGTPDASLALARTDQQPQARLYAEGHSDQWGSAAEYIAQHIEDWVSALLD